MTKYRYPRDCELGMIIRWATQDHARMLEMALTRNDFPYYDEELVKQYHFFEWKGKGVGLTDEAKELLKFYIL
jgi:hypothetical protein